MKTMSDTGHRMYEIGTMIFSWIFGLISLPVTAIPIILSSIASVMACINYYYQIRKHKK